MIVELGVVDDPERVGFYSGLIVSTRTSCPKKKQLIRFLLSGKKESAFSIMCLITGKFSPPSPHEKKNDKTHDLSI